MGSEIALPETVEQQELARKRQELADLQAKLIDREAFLEDLRSRLRVFEGRYLRQVGALYAELDEWNAKLAELAAKVDGTEQAWSVAAEARRQADESHAAAHEEVASASDTPPSPELKRLRNEVLLQIHPDLATDEADRLLRTRLTAEANEAFLRGDAVALRRILEEYRRSPESVKGQGIPADLERVQRQIDRITRRLVQIESEVSELAASELAMLMAKVESAAADGRDLLADMAKDVTRRIHLARREFEAQSAKLGAQ